MEAAAFEQQRLALFARNGFEGKSRWITDEAGRQTYVIARGDGRCPTVLVHGGLSQAGEWALMAGKLTGCVVIPDRPGCGLTYPIDYRKVPDYRKAAADWMLAVVDGSGAEQVDLVGGSMGGYFSVAFALEYPERVRRLVLVGAPAGLDRPIPLFLRLWGNQITGPLISKQRITDPEVLRRRVFARLLVARPEEIPLEFLEMMLAGDALPGVADSAYGLLRTVTTLRGFRSDLMLSGEMPRLSAPVLFLWGDADAFALPSRGEELVPEMRDARLEVLRGAGHLPHVDQPDKVAAEVGRFLAEANVPAY